MDGVSSVGALYHSVSFSHHRKMFRTEHFVLSSISVAWRLTNFERLKKEREGLVEEITSVELPHFGVEGCTIKVMHDISISTSVPGRVLENIATPPYRPQRYPNNLRQRSKIWFGINHGLGFWKKSQCCTAWINQRSNQAGQENFERTLRELESSTTQMEETGHRTAVT